MIVHSSASSNETAHASEKAASRKEYITIGALPPPEKVLESEKATFLTKPIPESLTTF
jgi:hypothetical protein